MSRYEKRHHLPPLETALACEAIFGIPIAELFAGMRQTVGKNIQKRRLELKARLQAETPHGSAALVTALKLRWIADREGSSVENQTTSAS